MASPPPLQCDETFTQCYCNVGPPFTTLAQHYMGECLVFAGSSSVTPGTAASRHTSSPCQISKHHDNLWLCDLDQETLNPSQVILIITGSTASLDVHVMLCSCWATVCDADPTLIQPRNLWGPYRFLDSTWYAQRARFLAIYVSKGRRGAAN